MCGHFKPLKTGRYQVSDILATGLRRFEIHWKLTEKNLTSLHDDMENICYGLLEAPEVSQAVM